ncbi:hypothetical protein BC941DRAFT_488909 [Chlamydoabsidia padenii]|nr:hypothetical protein BC941DRAFT_488909 [Chlamydoabsidia padenii]
MNYRHSIPIKLPPSPVDLTSPSLRKQNELQIFTNDNDHNRHPQPWTPPLSPPLVSGFQDRPLSQYSNNTTNRKKPRQHHSQKLDIDHLTLENAKLQRANRLLKVDREEWLEKRIQPMEQHIRNLTISNVRWQRAANLLQQEVEECRDQMAALKLNQTLYQKTGPEYDFLVNRIHQLQAQISMAHQEKRGGKLTDITKSELFVLLDKIHSLEQDLGRTLLQLAERDEDLAHCRSEISIKDQVMAQLQMDFDEIDKQVRSLQYMLEKGQMTTTTTSTHEQPVIQTTIEEMNMMLTATSRTRNRRRLIKKKEVLSIRDLKSPPATSDTTKNDPSLKSTPDSAPPVIHQHSIDDSVKDHPTDEQSPPNNNPAPSHPLTTMSLAYILPGSYPARSEAATHVYNDTSSMNGWVWAILVWHDLVAPFVITSFFLGLCTKLGISDDWLTPIILLVLVLGQLYQDNDHL